MKNSVNLVRVRGIALVLALLGLAPGAKAVNTELQWNPSVDETTAGYKIYAFSAVSTNVFTVGNITNTVVTDLEDGETYRFFVRAYNAEGYESERSNEVLHTFPVLNRAPVLNPIPSKTINIGTLLAFTASATNAESVTQTLTYSLEGAPAGAAISPSSGVFTWKPLADQGPSTNHITVIVTDNGSPVKSARQVVTVVVNSGDTPGTFYTLTVAAFTNGFVTVSPRSDAGIAREKFMVGTTVSVTATPKPGTQFVGWSLNGQSFSRNPFTFNMNGDRTLIPIFRAITGAQTQPSRQLIMTSVSGRPMMEISGELGAWVAEASDNLIDWVEIGTGLTSELMAGAEPTECILSASLDPE